MRLIYVGGAIAADNPARLRSQIIESRTASPNFVTETALFRGSLGIPFREKPAEGLQGGIAHMMFDSFGIRLGGLGIDAQRQQEITDNFVAAT